MGARLRQRLGVGTGAGREAGRAGSQHVGEEPPMRGCENKHGQLSVAALVFISYGLLMAARWLFLEKKTKEALEKAGLLRATSL